MGKFEPVITRTGAAIATQFTISTDSRTQDPMPTITPVALQAIPEVPSCARRRSINQPIPIEVIRISTAMVVGNTYCSCVPYLLSYSVV